MIKIIIIYTGKSSTGSTATLANWIKEGASSVSNTNVIIKRADEVQLEDISSADGIICGSGDYNGNPEPDMINFFDNILKAGSGSHLNNLKTLPFGVFATSGGYSTGVQEVLNSMVRSLMTFGAIFVGGGNWHVSQGIAGMTYLDKKTNKWDWVDKTGLQKYLKEDACSYGRRIALAAGSVSPGMTKLDKQNPNICVHPKPKPQPKPQPHHKSDSLSSDAKINISLLVIGLIILISLAVIWGTYDLLKVGIIISCVIGISCLIAFVLSHKDVKKRRNTALTGLISTLFIIIVIFVLSGYKNDMMKLDGAKTLVGVSFITLLSFFGSILLISKSKSSSKPSHGPTPSPHSGPTPSPHPPHYTGILIPQDLDTTLKSDGIKKYCQQNYPLLSNYHKDFWKSLDFFWNLSCARTKENYEANDPQCSVTTYVDCMPNYKKDDLKGDCQRAGCCYNKSRYHPWCYQPKNYPPPSPAPEKGDLYIPYSASTSSDGDIDTTNANIIFRYIVNAFLGSKKENSKSWLKYTPDPSKANGEKAGFTYSENVNGPGKNLTLSIPLYDITLLPLCSFDIYGRGSEINGVVINRYPEGHERFNTESYALTGTANSVKTSLVIPGVDLVNISEGFKDNSLVEILHCDTHSTGPISSTNSINSCDLLASKCPGHGPPGIGNGKWLYYGRGSGIWTNLGKTQVFRNKVHSVMGCINLWDGKDKRDNSQYVSDEYKGTLQGQFKDHTDLATWQKFAKDEDGKVRLALKTILTGPCLSTGYKKPSTAVINGFGDNQGSCTSSDFLNLGSSSSYTGPCTVSPKVYYCKQPGPNDVPMWWFHDPDSQTQMDWGALSPLAPNTMTSQSEKLGWLLWACVNGYDFYNNPNNYKWSDQIQKKFCYTQQQSHYANNLLSNMSNSGYSTDDVIISYANYNLLDSVQLTTSCITGNQVGFEILVFTGSYGSKTNDKNSKWICDKVNASTQCVGTSGEKESWIDTDTTTYLNIDPTNPTGKQVTCSAVKDNDSGYYLNCNTGKDQYVNYGNPYGFPMVSKDSIISSCN